MSLPASDNVSEMTLLLLLYGIHHNFTPSSIFLCPHSFKYDSPPDFLYSAVFFPFSGKSAKIRCQNEQFYSENLYFIMKSSICPCLPFGVLPSLRRVVPETQYCSFPKIRNNKQISCIIISISQSGFVSLYQDYIALIVLLRDLRNQYR